MTMSIKNGIRALALSTAFAVPARVPAVAQDLGAKNVILMISDGLGFNGWLASDCHQGVAGQQPCQIPRLDCTPACAIAHNPSRSDYVGIARARNTLQASRTNLPDGGTPSGMAVNPAVPDLATKSIDALNLLGQNPEGFFVAIEGGAVDWIGHANNMARFIEEQIDVDHAVTAVIDWVETKSNRDETLLIVTSDHETGGTWGEGTWTNGTGGSIAAGRSDAALTAARFHPAEDVSTEFRAVQVRGAGTIPGHGCASRTHTNECVPLWAPAANISHNSRSRIWARSGFGVNPMAGMGPWWATAQCPTS